MTEKLAWGGGETVAQKNKSVRVFAAAIIITSLNFSRR